MSGKLQVVTTGLTAVTSAVVLCMAMFGGLDGKDGRSAPGVVDPTLPDYLQQAEEKGYKVDNDTEITVINMGKDWIDNATFCDHGNRIYQNADGSHLAVVPADPTCTTH